MANRTTPAGYLSVADTADKLGVSPWDVLGLTERGDLEAITLIDAESLANYERRTA